MKGFLSGAALGALAGAWLMHVLQPPAAAGVSMAAPLAATAAAPVAPVALVQPAASLPAVAAPPRPEGSRDAPRVAAAAPATTPPLYPPLPALSQEHQRMVQGDEQQAPTPAELHQRMGQEPLDPAWSPRLEAEINAFLQREAQPPVFETMGVSCRLSLCRIALFVNGADGHERWRELSRQLGEQAWWKNEFSGFSTSTSGLHDRKAVMVLLERKRR